MANNVKDNDIRAWGWEKRWPAPAKINLMLRITGRLESGYHSLQTVFQMTDLCDWIRFYPLTEDEVCLKHMIPGVAENDDLTVRAARLLKQHGGYKSGVMIEIDKHLPMGGGLGGGSSDAATTLVVLNQLWGLGLSKPVLMDLGLQLGADVPVFVFGGAAWGEGVGEELQEIALDEKWLVIIKPDVHVDTGEVFSNKDLTRDSKCIKIADFLAGDERNDCLDVVCEKYQSIKDAMRAMSVYAPAKLTGTGACVFAQFGSERQAHNAYLKLSADWRVYLAKGLNKSPLYQQLESD